MVSPSYGENLNSKLLDLEPQKQLSAKDIKDIKNMIKAEMAALLMEMIKK